MEDCRTFLYMQEINCMCGRKAMEINMKKIREIEYKSFGRCLEISNNIVDLIIPLEIGPRILRFGFCGEVNMFCEDGEVDKNVPTDEEFSCFGDRGVWHNFGGHRLWAAPEAHPRTYYPDNKPISYKTEGNKVIIEGDTQMWTNIHTSMEIELAEGAADAKVVHVIKNTGPWDVELAPWAISVMAPGGTLVVKRPEGGDTLLPNTFMALWGYASMDDPRFYMKGKYIYLKQDNLDTNFKFGINNINGFAAYENGGTMFVKKYDVNPLGNYPDGGMSFEGYTNNVMLEVESLGEMQKLSPGGVVAHTERWQLIKVVKLNPEDEKNTDEICAKYIF